MIETLPQSIWNELHQAQSQAAQKRTRLRVDVKGDSYHVLRLTSEGFVLDLQDAPKLCGLVDLYDGGRHLCQCLIVSAHEDADQMVYDFKRNPAAGTGAPLDFERIEEAPIAF